MKSWISVSSESDFPIQNIPFGVFQTATHSPRVATIIGEKVIDLSALAAHGYLDAVDFDKSVFSSRHINDYMALGKPVTNAIRAAIQDIFNKENTTLQNNSAHQAEILHDVKSVELLMPIKVGDYTDFYSSRDHAINVGTMFRDPENALLPNWLHLPVGYHGRASSIIGSGTPIRRPKGQQMPAGADKPVFGASKLLDFELEMAFVIGQSNEMGTSISTVAAEDHIFGMVIFNDWSARDIQKWEYIPLGPFLAKNFASSISPWVVTLEALDGFKVESPVQEPKVLPYLEFDGNKNYDIRLEVDIIPENGQGKTVSQSNYKYMYWNMCQQLAHHTVNGCNMNVGDMLASGTISGPEAHEYGSMLELSWRGTKPIPMPDGSERKFINDGDTVVMRGFGLKDGVRIGFGEVSTSVLPAS
jgi:fumarylacetoacetase